MPFLVVNRLEIKSTLSKRCSAGTALVLPGQIKEGSVRCIHSLGSPQLRNPSGSKLVLFPGLPFRHPADLESVRGLNAFKFTGVRRHRE